MKFITKPLSRLVLGAALVFAVAACGENKYTDVSADANGLVSISLAEVSDGAAHYYTYNVNGRDVRFFVLKSSDGVIRAAFDACDVCYPEKKGYRQEGDYMVCNNCGQRFISTRINVVKGGCNPSPLRRETRGSNLLITERDIQTGLRYF